ncbi:hypothetical protein FQN54_005874 [Arachnomyces sp. PD_36]|nr:hypothetical protein FQN54_005874 [Arachnomyces sp. PD_36]
MAKSAMTNAACDPNKKNNFPPNKNNSLNHPFPQKSTQQNSNQKKTLMPPSSKTVVGRALGSELHQNDNVQKTLSPDHGVGCALTDTPVSTAPSSPQIFPRSTPSTPNKSRATTLDIPGLTKSKVSPDGRIAQRDVGSKLVIVMVGLPARGKSYVTKKLARYLNWLQHDTKIFNVGERRRVAVSSATLTRATPENTRGGSIEELRDSVRHMSVSGGSTKVDDHHDVPPAPAKILVNGQAPGEGEIPGPDSVPDNNSGESTPTQGTSPSLDVPLGEPAMEVPQTNERRASVEPYDEAADQSAKFFDPNNQRAVQFREQVALVTLDELLDYILEEGGSVGILDATNSTLERRKAVMDHIRDRAGPELGVLFLESRCVDQELLESNMRLKLSGPDYRDQDPVTALADFKRRVALYEQSYVPLGDYEEQHNMAYVQMIDVGRKVVSHQTNGFLSSQVVYYLLNFNLSPRQIWITRHGESMDNVSGKIGGDSDLTEDGVRYAKALTAFIGAQRKLWQEYQEKKAMSTHFPPLPGDSTPPNPQYGPAGGPRNFCVWSSMLKRSIQTVQYFNDDDFDVKQMRMLDELHAGTMEGMTYKAIREQFPEEYAHRKKEKLRYRYPGPGGEGYLDVINRLRAVIVEVERMTDHVLLVGHRSVARVLLAYFRGLKREEVADLDVPLGTLYMLEPKPYGVEFKGYRYNPETDWFDEIPNFELTQSTVPYY